MASRSRPISSAPSRMPFWTRSRPGRPARSGCRSGRDRGLAGPPARDAVLDEIAAWQARPLEPVYPLIFFDALRVKIREEALVRNKAVHVALGVRADGTKEILGLWIEQTEGAKFWLRVMSE